MGKKFATAAIVVQIINFLHLCHHNYYLVSFVRTAIVEYNIGFHDTAILLLLWWIMLPNHHYHYLILQKLYFSKIFLHWKSEQPRTLRLWDGAIQLLFVFIPPRGARPASTRHTQHMLKHTQTFFNAGNTKYQHTAKEMQKLKHISSLKQSKETFVQDQNYK